MSSDVIHTTPPTLKVRGRSGVDTLGELLALCVTPNLSPKGPVLPIKCYTHTLTHSALNIVLFLVKLWNIHSEK